MINAAAPPLDIEDATIAIGGKEVVRGLSFRVKEPSSIAIVGPSGCGKTTLLRAIAGFHRCHGGNIRVCGHPSMDCHGKGLVEYLHQRSVAWPHLTVRGNLELARKLHGHEVDPSTIDELLEILELSRAADLYPFQLSGGMQARVSLARVFAMKPQLVLADEPFASLDTMLRTRLNHEFSNLRTRFNTTVVWVTHDVVEAVTNAHTVLVFSGHALGSIGIEYPTRLTAPVDVNQLGHSHLCTRDRVVQFMGGGDA